MQVRNASNRESETRRRVSGVPGRVIYMVNYDLNRTRGDFRVVPKGDIQDRAVRYGDDQSPKSPALPR